MKKKIVCLLMGCLLIANSCIKPVDAFVVVRRVGTNATGAQDGGASNGDQDGAGGQQTTPNEGQQNAPRSPGMSTRHLDRPQREDDNGSLIQRTNAGQLNFTRATLRIAPDVISIRKRTTKGKGKRDIEDMRDGKALNETIVDLEKIKDLDDVHEFENGITVRKSTTSSFEPSFEPSEAYMDDDTLKYDNKALICCDTVIKSENPQERSKIHFNCLTISSSSVIFENLEITGEIRVRNDCKVEFRNCYIHDVQEESQRENREENQEETQGETQRENQGENQKNKQESLVELASRSSAVFDDCQIESSVNCTCCVCARNNSHANFRGCNFHSLGKGSILAMDVSSVYVLNCDFVSSKGHDVYAHRNSSALVEKCNFNSNEKTSVFAMKNCRLEVNDCYFNDVLRGVIAGESCETVVKNCKFNSTSFFGVSAFRSGVQVLCCEFNNCKGNGVKLKRSDGLVEGCKFIDFDMPSVYVFGCKNVLVHSCRFSGNKEHPFIRVRFNSTVAFNDIKIDDFNEQVPVISCTDLSSVVLTGLDIGSKDKIPEIMVCNASKLKILPLKLCLVKVFKEDGTEEDFNSSSECSLGRIHVTEKTSGEVLVLDPEEVRLAEDVKPDTINCDCVEIGKNQEHPHLISDTCGHPIVCPECGEHMALEGDGQLKCEHCETQINLKEEGFTCPICKINVEGPIKEFISDRCVLCLKNGHADVTFLPCGHRCVCKNCIDKFLENSKSCMMRCPVCEVQTVFLAYDFSPQDDEGVQ